MNEKHYSTREMTADNGEERAEFGVVALRRIREILREKATEGKIILSDFRNVYDKNEILADLRKVATLKEEIAQELESAKKKNWESRQMAEVSEYNKILREIMEMAITEFGETSNWFGEEAHSGQTSEYDDMFNGVDMVLVFGDEDNTPIALTIDVTSAKDISVLDKKIETICHRALDHRSDKRSVKYYQSPVDPENRGSIEAIPVVVGFAKETATKLIATVNELMALENKGGKKDNDKTRIKQIKKGLSEHPLQMNMLEEILCQLNYYLKKIGPGRDEYKEKIQFLQEKIEQVVNEKTANGLRADDEDAVYKRIKNNIASR